jgi:hypothetical protein
MGGSMGREATCECTVADTTAKVKVLLETHELILRGPIRMTAPLNALKNIRVESEALCFTHREHAIRLRLGAKAAESWARKIRTPPPTLSDKLGITGKIVRTIGPVEKPINSALESAALVGPENSAMNPDIIIACIDTPESLASTLREAKKQLARSIPIWLVYRKGPGHAINEAIIRTTLRAQGLMDTKVASVSDHLTALRFNRPKSS